MADLATDATALAERTGVDRHDVLVVLGSGWAGAALALGEPTADLATAALPGLVVPVAPGHDGRLRSYERAGLRVLVALGRTHLYEGLGVDAVTATVRLAAAAGCRTAVLTNASGSLRDHWPPGTPVVLRDHLDLARCASRGVRPSSTVSAHREVWSGRLRALVQDVAPGTDEGVYAILPGPHYNTRAEAVAMRTLGADLVGMSTVPEAIAASGLGIDVLGLSIVTTQEIDGPPIDPDEVVRVAERSATAVGGTIAAVIDRLASGKSSGSR